MPEGRLRILFCTLGYDPAPAGGAEHQARLQAEELVRRGHHVTVVCPGAPRVSSGWIDGVYVQRLPRAQRKYLRTLTYLAMLAAYLLLRLRRFDLVHVHLANLQADIVAILARALNKPVYVKIAAGGDRGDIGRMTTVARLTRRAGLRSAACVQALSGEIASELTELGISPRRVLLIPNGLDGGTHLPVTRGERQASRRQLLLPESAVIVLYVGRFAGYKGIGDLVGAWGDVAVAHPDAWLVLVGGLALDDPLRPLPSAERVIYRGWTDAILEYYRAADIFVLPSHTEGMSNSLLEAMGCGLAVVATRVGAAPEMIRDGESGVLVMPGDRKALVAALMRLTDDGKLRLAMGRAAAESVRTKYTISRVVDRIERAYGDILAER